MKTYNIRSLEELRRHKVKVKKELTVCETKIREDYYKITHPFESYIIPFAKKNIPIKGVTIEQATTAISVVRKAISFARVGYNVYKSLKKS